MEDCLECAICFDPLSESTLLPCACNISYCERCWDRSLAASFKSSGQARCPSCRGPVRVDFDANAADGRGRLVFSRETVDMTYARQYGEIENYTRRSVASDANPNTLEESPEHESQEQDQSMSFVRLSREMVQHAQDIEEARDAVVERLAEQAVPSLIRSLKLYGESHPSLRVIAQDPHEGLKNETVSDLKAHLEWLGGAGDSCVEKSEVIEKLIDVTSDSGALAASWISKSDQARGPACVCGGFLRRVSGRQRLEFFIASQHGLSRDSSRFREEVEYYSDIGSSSVICDVCEQEVAFNNYVWTCDTGDQTILHATSYDVCEGCFLSHSLLPLEDVHRG